MPRRKSKPENTANANDEKTEVIEVAETETTENANVEKNAENNENEPAEEIELIEEIPEAEEEPTPDIVSNFDKIEEVIEIEEKEFKRQAHKNLSAFKESILGTMVILGVISFVTVLILAIMNSITAPVIAQRLADEKRESIASLFGDEIEYDIAPEYIVSAPVTEAIIVKNIWSKELDGYCVIVTPKGFNGKIVMLVAVNPDITVKDIKILEMSETAGQGTKIDSEKSFRDQFKYKTKDIRIGITGENTVNVIAGATVSSRAFVNGVNAALAAADEISRKMSGAEDELPTEEFEQPDDDTEPDGINDLDELNETAENEEESAGENPDE